MRDFVGKELKVGDEVIVGQTPSTRTYFLQTGWIHHFAKRGGYEVAEVVFSRGDLYRDWKDISGYSTGKRGFASHKIAKK